MADLIKAGDLVMVVKPRQCGCADSLGAIFRAMDVLAAQRGGYCHTCNKTTFPAGARVALQDDATACELWRLIKIDPPAEDSSIEHKEELTA